MRKLTVLAEDSNTLFSMRAYLRDDGKIEIWHKKPQTELWDFNHCYDPKELKSYSVLFNQIIEKLK